MTLAVMRGAVLELIEPDRAPLVVVDEQPRRRQETGDQYLVTWYLPTWTDQHACNNDLVSQAQRDLDDEAVAVCGRPYLNLLREAGPQTLQRLWPEEGS